MKYNTMESEGEGGGNERRAVVQEVMAAILILALVGWLAVSAPRNLLVLLAGSASAARKQRWKDGRQAVSSGIPIAHTSAIAHPVSIRRCW